MTLPRSLLLDLLTGAALLIALFTGARTRVVVPQLEQLERVEGTPVAFEEVGELLRFRLGAPARSIAVRAPMSAGWVSLRSALREGQSLTLWVEPSGAGQGLAPSPDAWQIAAGTEVLVPLADTVRWAEREARLGRTLCVAFAAAAGVLLASHRLPRRGRSPKPVAGLGGPRGPRAQLVVSAGFALLGTGLLVHAWDLREASFDLQERAGAIASRELRSSQGRLNSLRLRLEGHGPQFVLFRKGTPGFEALVERLTEGLRVELTTDSDRALAARGPLEGLFLKPRVHGVRVGDEQLLSPDRTRASLRASALPVLLGGLALVALGMRAARGALAR